MKLRLTSILIALFLVSSTLVFAETAEEIMEKCIQAAGSGKMKDVKSQIFEMKMSMMGMEMPMKSYIRNPDDMRVEMSAMGMDIVTVINATAGWMKQAGTVTDIPADQLDMYRKQLKQQTNFYSEDLFNYKGEGGKLRVTLLGKEKVDGKECYKIKNIDQDEKEALIFVECSNYLIAKVSSKQDMMGAETDVEVFMKDYKDIEGIKIPHLMEIKSGGELFGTITIQNWKMNVPLDDKLFQKP